MALSRKHFQAVADALYSSRPEPRFRARYAQWLRTRDAVATSLRMFSSRFNRSRFDQWTEEGDPAMRRARQQRDAR